MKEVEANSKLNTEVNDSECSTLAYIGIALTILSMATVIFLHFRKSMLPGSFIYMLTLCYIYYIRVLGTYCEYLS